MQQLELFQVSSLEKVFLHKRPECEECREGYAFHGDYFSYQVVFTECGNDRDILQLQVKIDSPIKQYVQLYRVEHSPSEMPAYTDSYDDDYLTIEPGLFPNVLYPFDENSKKCPRATLGKYRTLWVEVPVTEDINPGTYPIKISISAEDANEVSTEFALHVGAAKLPEQKLIFTQWFHCDCIADVYKVPILSEEHWNRIDQFIKMAAEHGINMLMAPLITPPLDTGKDIERPTVQLVDIERKNGVYRFCFDQLRRYAELCKKNGISYLEMPPLFSQWGAEFTPKIVVKVDGKEEKLFGWHVKADAPEYAEFLDQLLPALVTFLKEINMEKHTYFHISDEPNGESNLEQYKKAQKRIREHIKGFPQIDAMSHYELYEAGLVEHPVVAIDSIKPFLEHNVRPLWCYYCCGQNQGVSNRFFGMPSYRNRVIGVQLYKFDVAGFLQWGYNFYYNQYSRGLINPFLTTDAEGAFPSGDAFSVYPGEDGPIASIPLKVFREALQDLRALRLLEEKFGREKVLELIEDGLSEPIAFDCYPKRADYLLDLRKRIFDLLK